MPEGFSRHKGLGDVSFDYVWNTRSHCSSPRSRDASPMLLAYRLPDRRQPRT